MEDLQAANDKRKKQIGCWMLLIVFVILPFIAITFGHRSTIVADSVALKAKSWNEGKVHVWHGLGAPGDDESHTDVSESATCKRLDNKTYQIRDGGPPIYYYRLSCDGITGYVETDQVR